MRYFDNPDGYDYDYDYQNHHQSSYSPHLLATIDIECKDFRKFAPWTSRFRMSILNWIQEKFSGNIYFMMRYTNQYVRLGYVDYDSKDWILFPICGSTEGPLGSFYCGRYADYIMTFASLNILLIRGMHNYSPILMVNTTSNNTIQSNINPSSITTFLAFGDAVYTAHGGNIYKWHGLYSYIEVYYYVYINYGNGLSLSIKPKLLLIGLEPWTSIFQFHMTIYIYGLTIYFGSYHYSQLGYQIKFSKINSHDSELMIYVHFHGRQLPKLLLHIQFYHDDWKFQWEFELLHRKFY